ncbi:porin [uncultured Alistipes sp.]|uniref:porin n=1 Tax=uncultured Alistipes sp. TaxID=538949 RepID=UPI002628F9E2|nr:porin [uncultured Alistipes sp.]
MKPLLTLALLAWSLGARAGQPAAELPAAAPATGASVVGTAPVPASAAVPAAETPSLESLAAEVAALKAQAAARDARLDRLPRLSGYVQAGYEWSDGSSSFFIKRVRLDLRGALARTLDYRVQLEFASSPKIVDAYLQYRPFRQLNFKLGEYKIPFTIENTDYVPLKFELIEYPLALQRLMGFAEPIGGRMVGGVMQGGETLKDTGRDMGLTLYGTLVECEGRALLSYDVGVFNGAGINLKDNNRSKDVVARLMFRPVRGLTLSGSWYGGEYGADCLERQRVSAGVCYDHGRGVVRGEWIGGRTGYAATEEYAAGTFDSSGWYVLGGVRVTPSLMPVVRYDTLLPDTASADSRQTNWTAGILWHPVKYLRCQLNYTYEHYAAPGIADRNVVAVMFSGIF